VHALRCGPRMYRGRPYRSDGASGRTGPRHADGDGSVPRPASAGVAASARIAPDAQRMLQHFASMASGEQVGPTPPV
jgi:hypothetical protein